MRHVHAFKQDLSFIDRRMLAVKPHDSTTQSSFAGAGFACKSNHLPRIYLQIDPSDSLYPAFRSVKGQMQIFDFQNRSTCLPAYISACFPIYLLTCFSTRT